MRFACVFGNVWLPVGTLNLVFELQPETSVTVSAVHHPSESASAATLQYRLFLIFTQHRYSKRNHADSFFSLAFT
jgi:hypothetical protein